MSCARMSGVMVEMCQHFVHAGRAEVKGWPQLEHDFDFEA